MERRPAHPSVGRSAKAFFIGEAVVAILEVKGPLESRQIIEHLVRLDSMRHFNIGSVGQIAGATPGIFKLRARPRAIFSIEPGRQTQLPAKTHSRLLEILSENLPPTGEERV